MYIILFNPLAKNKKAMSQVTILEKHFQKLNMDYRLKNLITITDLKSYVESLPQEATLILVGGDGTINHVANDLLTFNYKGKLLIYPSGSGNDFVQSLKTLDYDVLNPLKDRTEIKEVDTKHFKRYFVNGCGIGIDGEIVLNVSHSKYKNKLSYLYETLKTVFVYQPTNGTVTLDGNTFHVEKMWICAIQNGKYFGGGMMIAPDADLFDDYLDVCIVHGLSRMKLLTIFPKIYSGKHIEHMQHVIYQRVKKISVKLESPRSGQIDGDYFPPTDELNVERKSNSLLLNLFKR